MAAVSAQDRKLLLGELNSFASHDLAKLWKLADQLSSREFARFIIDAFPEVADQYAATASTLAADWYEQSAPDSTYRATEAQLKPTQALESSAQWALNTTTGSDALALLTGTLQRAVLDGARGTTIYNVGREAGARWARHASANACAFCRVLATRGGVYGSRESAMKAHDHCHCLAVEVRPGQSYEPAPYVEGWERDYVTARRAAGSGDLKSIVAAMEKASQS